MIVYDYTDKKVKHLALGRRARESLNDFFEDMEDRKRRCGVKLWLKPLS